MAKNRLQRKNGHLVPANQVTKQIIYRGNHYHIGKLLKCEEEGVGYEEVRYKVAHQRCSNKSCCDPSHIYLGEENRYFSHMRSNQRSNKVEVMENNNLVEAIQNLIASKQVSSVDKWVKMNDVNFDYSLIYILFKRESDGGKFYITKYNNEFGVWHVDSIGEHLAFSLDKIKKTFQFAMPVHFPENSLASKKVEE